MPIDASIYRDSPGRQQQNSMLQMLSDLQDVRMGRTRNRLLDLQAQGVEDQMGQRDKLRALLSSMDPSSSAADQAGQLQRGGFLKEGRDLLQADALAQKTQREGEKAQIETAGKRAELAGQVMGAVTDQASYDRARQYLASQLGPGVAERMPPLFDPHVVGQMAQQAISAKDQIAQQLQAMQQQETGRHNRVTETETARNNDMDNRIAQGQLGIAGGQLAVSRQNAGETARHNRANEGLKGQEIGALSSALSGGKVPGGYMLDPSAPGTVRPIPGGPADEASKPLNDTQAKALLFGNRAKESVGVLDQMASQGVVMPSQTKRFAEAIPGVGGALGALANATVASPKQQRVEQAQRDIVNALLRRESGAAISASEFENAKQQYFPQFGETDPSLLQQKRENLRTAINGILAEVPQSRRPGLIGTAGTPAGAATTGAAPATDDPLGLRGGR